MKTRVIAAFALLVTALSSASAAGVLSTSLDSLLSRLQVRMSAQQKPDTALVRLLLDISFAYKERDAKKGIAFAERAMQLATELNFRSGIAAAYKYKGANLWTLGDNEAALVEDEKARKAYHELRMPLEEAHSVDDIGIVHLYMGHNAQALEAFFEALRIEEANHLEKNTAYENRNIGDVYANMNDFGKAVHYYRLALQKAGLHDLKVTAAAMGSLGNVYNLQHMLDSAVIYYRRSLALAEEAGDNINVAASRSNLGSIARQQRHYDEAIQQFQSALAHDRAVGSKEGMGVHLYNCGATWYDMALDSTHPAERQKKTQLLKLALSYFDSALTVSKELKDNYKISASANALSEVYELLDDHRNALAYYKTWKSTEDSIYNETNRRKIAQLETDRMAEIRARQLEAEAAAKDRNNKIQLASIGLFIIMLIGAVLLLSKRKVPATLLNILSTFSVLLIFELTALLLHPFIENLTHHHLTLTLLCLVAIASVIVPLHHKADHWMKNRLVNR